MRFTGDGCLVYSRAKMKNSLIYYSNSDMRHATLRGLGPGETALPSAFEVSLAPKEELEFAPGAFVAAYDKERAQTQMGGSLRDASEGLARGGCDRVVVVGSGGLG